MKVTARRRHGFAHDVEIEGGHAIVVDEPPQAGGNDAGPRPTLLLAASLASCTAVTMEMYAERKGWELGEVEVDVDVTYEGAAPSAFDVTLRLRQGLSEEQRGRLRTIAAKCPVHKVVAGATPVTVAERIESL